ncbi:MAG TPA: hypothetical protein VI140_07215, partial [Oxalicibacterium sp.]
PERPSPRLFMMRHQGGVCMLPICASANRRNAGSAPCVQPALTASVISPHLKFSSLVAGRPILRRNKRHIAFSGFRFSIHSPIPQY